MQLTHQCVRTLPDILKDSNVYRVAQRALIGAHHAAPHDPILTAARVATSPFEACTDNMGSA